MSQDFAKRCDVERLKQTIDKLSNSQETFVEEPQIHFSQLVGVSRGIHSAHPYTIPRSYNQKANIICETHVICYGPIKASKVRF